MILPRTGRGTAVSGAGPTSDNCTFCRPWATRINMHIPGVNNVASEDDEPDNRGGSRPSHAGLNLLHAAAAAAAAAHASGRWAMSAGLTGWEWSDCGILAEDDEPSTIDPLEYIDQMSLQGPRCGLTNTERQSLVAGELEASLHDGGVRVREFAFPVVRRRARCYERWWRIKPYDAVRCWRVRQRLPPIRRHCRRSASRQPPLTDYNELLLDPRPNVGVEVASG